MPSYSIAQQQLFGPAYDYLKNDTTTFADAKKLADEFVERYGKKDAIKKLKDFAKTKHKGLPKKKEGIELIVHEIIKEYFS